ncbi:MAG: cation:dicarboxylase symporter family transporter [Clostridia bacterium]|nr:cation:dicarboxylase symporter family transporter [Clostridia bacterium]
MKIFRQKSQIYTLTNEGIDMGIIAFENDLTKKKLNRKKALSINFSFQEVLLKYQDIFSQDTQWFYVIRRRHGRLVTEIHVVGDRVNVIEQDRGNDFDIMAHVGINLADSNKFRYHKGENIVTIHMVNYLKQVTIKMVIALVLGLAFGIGLTYLDPSVASGIVEVVGKVTELLEKLLDAISVPAACFAIIFAICMMGDKKTAYDVGGSLIARIIVYSLVTTAITLFVAAVVLGWTKSAGDAGDLSVVINALTDMVPSNLFTPFARSKALQVVFMGIVIGLGLLVAGDKGNTVAKVLHEFNLALDLCFDWIMKIFPLFVFLSVSKFSFEDEYKKVLNAGTLWMIVVFLLSAAILKLLSMLILKKHGFDIKTFLHNIRLAFIIALSTASVSAAGGEINRICSDVYHVDKKLADLSEKVCETAFMPMLACLASALTAFYASESGVEMSLIWFLTMLIIIPVMTMACPPAPGSGVGIIVALFASAGIGQGYIAVAMLLELIFEYIGTALNAATTIALTITVGEKKGLIGENHVH